MNTYSDNQTGHLYVVTEGIDVTRSTTVNHMFNLKIKQGSEYVQSDVIDDRRILSVTTKHVDPIYYRKWTVDGLIDTDIVGNTTYYLYFYLENMIGFGINDRLDIVANYHVATTVDSDVVMINLAMDLYGKINVYGPIKGDFKISVGGVNLTASDYTAFVENGTLLDISSGSGNDIVITEDSTSPTYKRSDIEMMTGAHPYEYDLTLSTYRDDTNTIWGADNGRRIYAENTSTPRFSSGVIVRDMENFFARNRADLYSLSPNFNANIINDLHAVADEDYDIVNVHYAFSDGLGFTYYSEKDLMIAVPATSTSDFTPFAQATANDPGALVSDSGKYYYLPNGHTAGATLAATTKVEVDATKGYSDGIAAMFA